jgi:penicillin-binding protein 1A
MSERKKNRNWLPRRPKAERSDTPKRGVTLAAVGRGVVIFILICIIAASIVAAVLTVYVLELINTEEVISLEDVKLSLTTIMYATDKPIVPGTPPNEDDYYELERIQNVENRIWVDYDQIPEHVVNAAIAIEDKRFREHQGVDWARTASAALNYFLPTDTLFGGSTITQQLIKNVTGDNDVSPQRKVQEIFRALNLEKAYSKEQIMETYLNTINLGNGVYGVQSAANLYFGKDVSELTVAEGAAIIAITKNPTVYNPFRYPENNRVRQGDILYFMHEQGLLDEQTYLAAYDEELAFKKEEYIARQSTTRSWFVDYVFGEVVEDLVSELGYEENYATSLLLSGGYRIYTTVDKEMQDYLEKAYTNPETFPALVGRSYPDDYPESAFVVMDLNGQLRAMVGSNRTKEGALLFNRASDAMRQPGSAIKPVATYALALEENWVHWSSVVDDNPILLDEDDPESIYPLNHYRSYLGNMLLPTAIQRSTNTIPVKLIQQITPRRSFNFMRDKLGIDTLVERRVSGGQVLSDIDLAPMALGGLTDGVHPLQLIASYQIFGNGGYYTKPYSYTHVYDNEGNLILEKRPVATRVISPETATILNQLLQTVTQPIPGATGASARLQTNYMMPVAGKTGTSDNDHDQWFIGMTPYYLAGCWLGFDIPERIVYYNYAPPIIFSRIMGPIHYDKPTAAFPIWGNVEQKTYCTETGMIATPDCPHPSAGSGWYKLTYMPPTCTLHAGTLFEEENETEEEDDGNFPFYNWYDEDND